MAIDDLPSPVVTLLNVIGIPWPYIDEQAVWNFADLVRQFKQAVVSTHQNATQSFHGIATAHQGSSTQAMLTGWANLSNTHISEITTASDILADALEAAGYYIVAQKAEAIAELVALAASFIADQAAAVVTFGLSEAALPLIEEGAEKVMESLEQDLQQYIAGKVIDAALTPFLAKISSALSGLDWSQSGASAPPGDKVSITPADVYAHAGDLRTQAASLRTQASGLAAKIRELSF